MQPKQSKNKKPKIPFMNLYWLYMFIGLTMIGLYFFEGSSMTKEVSWSEFQTIAQTNGVTEMQVYRKKLILEATLTKEEAIKVFKVKPNEISENPMVSVEFPSMEVLDTNIKAWQENYGMSAKISYKDGGSSFTNFLWNFGPIILLVIFWFFIMGRMNGGAGGGGGGMGNVFNVGKAKAQLFDKENGTKVTFKDVAGLSEAKEEIEEIVAFLKNPGKYTELGGKIPKGALLVGPPGTGKTLLAKAVAGEANVPFFSMSGSDFVEMFVGVGASRVRDLFRQAKEKAPCIVFIDEIDAVGRARGRNANMGGNDERENTLNQLLTEMDGFGSNSGVIVLAATNRVDILDKALLRAGRFDRQIHVDLPDVRDRKEIFAVHLRPVKIDNSVDLEFLARQTPGFSGADIANVCNEAALIAARKGKSFVQKEDFMNAVDRIIGGLEKKSKMTTNEEKRAIAIHESGHATLSWFLEYANPLVKVTIVPRGKALGAAWYLPEERQITTKEQILDEMCATLGGRAAEELFLGRISTGALNDLERVSKQAYALVAYYGMGDTLKNISYYDSTGQDFGFSKPYSEKTAEEIDKQVAEIIDSQYQRAKELLSSHQEGHSALANELIEKEVIYKESLEVLFGPRPWKSRQDELLALNGPTEQEVPQSQEEPQTEESTLPSENVENND